MNPIPRSWLVGPVWIAMGLVFSGITRADTLLAQTASSGSTPTPNVVGAPAPTRGFSLFANADFAVSGMRGAGRFSWAVTNIGPCASGFGALENGLGCGRFNNVPSIFESVLSAGVSRTDFEKIRAIHPAVEGHQGPTGYTELSSHLRIGGTSQDWGPADNSIGRLFSGVRSTTDDSCRDDRDSLNDWVIAGTTLLASSDCPETWPRGAFDGPRSTPRASFLKLKAREGNAFNFDWFRVSPEERGHTRFLGSFSTYGEISDHFSEAIQSYGRVTPRGPDRSPTRNGFPLGLDVRFDAYTFSRPMLANAVFWQMTVVNNSKLVYGTGIDYDSLYMGLSNGLTMTASDNSTSHYALPHRNAMFAVFVGVTPGCNGALTSVSAPLGSCRTPGGFVRGHAYGILMLKSPIGDTRNKLLTRPGPFFDPSSPFADDTITFNHHHQCGFGVGCYNSTYTVNDRRGFGMISSTEENVLDGRDPAALPPHTHWITFRSKSFPAQPAIAFNRYVPGTWSYENKLRSPAATSSQDTIFYDMCEGSGFITVPNQNGGRPLPRCSIAFSDTFPGKQVASNGGNAGAVMTAGPFRLKAGDTTSFILAYFAERDSSAFEALADNITNEYLNFLAGPEELPAPIIRGAQVVSAENRRATSAKPAVTLIFSDEPEVAVDAYLTRFAQDVRTAPAPSFRRLRQLNPGLADSIDRVAQNNFAELLIYRSCDGGQMFDSRTSCASLSRSRLRHPNTPYAVVRADNAGTIPNAWTDTTVLPGVTYLYSLVTRSRGLTLGVIDVDSTDQTAACLADTTYVACRKAGRILIVADTVMGAPLTEGPSTAKVYVPITSPAGGATASVRITTKSGTATAPLDVQLTQRPISGDYRVIFGNRFIVQQTTNIPTNVTTTLIHVQSVIPSATRAGVFLRDHVERDIVLTSPGPLDMVGVNYTPSVSTSADIRVETDTIAGLGFVLAVNNQVYFLSQSLSSTEAAPATPMSFMKRPDFPGFLLSLDQSAAATLREEVVLLPTGDTLETIGASPFVELREQSTVTVGGHGQYTFTFADDAFGPGGPFRLDDPALATKLRESITNRVAAGVGDTTLATRAVVGPARGPSVRPIRFPFTVTSASGNPVIPVGLSRALARTGPVALRNTILLGEGNDTLRVDVDTLAWLPGDPFMLLEIVDADSIIGTAVVVDAAGKRVTHPDTVVAFNPIVLGCDQPNANCNPLTSGVGSTGYLPHAPNTRLRVDYPVPFSSLSEIDIRVNGAAALVNLTRGLLNGVRVVPNPFVLYSKFEATNTAGGEPRLMFTGLPARGMIRIYSVSGQFVQQLIWGPNDLQGKLSGDLPWNLRSRHGALVGSGLYMYVLTAQDIHGKTIKGRGKFVVIR